MFVSWCPHLFSSQVSLRSSWSWFCMYISVRLLFALVGLDRSWYCWGDPRSSVAGFSGAESHGRRNVPLVYDNFYAVIYTLELSMTPSRSLLPEESVFAGARIFEVKRFPKILDYMTVRMVLQSQPPKQICQPPPSLHPLGGLGVWGSL